MAGFGRISAQPLYGVEVTPELVEMDDNGCYAKLMLHFYLTVGNEYVKQKDKRTLDKLTENTNGKLFKPDVNKKLLSLKIHALKLLGIERFFDSTAEFSSQSLSEWFEAINNPLTRSQIKDVLNITIHPEKDTAIGVAQRLLALLGLKLEFKHHAGGRGNKHRVYSGCDLNLGGRQEIFAVWLEREQKFKEAILNSQCIAS